jgi:hypothetical protein
MIGASPTVFNDFLVRGKRIFVPDTFGYLVQKSAENRLACIICLSNRDDETPSSLWDPVLRLAK